MNRKAPASGNEINAGVLMTGEMVVDALIES
jgi:hypothetical protein